MSSVDTKVKSYSIKEIPPEIWRKLKIRSIREGVTVKELFRRWIQHYAEGK